MTATIPEECRRWDERYAAELLYFGDEHNPYLAASLARCFPVPVTRGRALCLGEGEGRDALYLARAGFAVTAVDGAVGGLEKLSRRAAAASLAIETVHADLASHEPAPGSYDLVAAFYCHLPPAVRAVAHARAARALRPRGVFVIEGFTPRQRELNLLSGGPKDVALLFEPAIIARELADAGLVILEAGEEEIELAAGRHRGRARVARVLARSLKENQ